MIFTATGTLRYSPKREGLKGRTTREGPWIILDCPPEIGRYYRQLYRIGHRYCRKIQRPYWGPHITIAKNEEPADDVWREQKRLYHGKEISFQYLAGIHNNWRPERFRSFYWLDVLPCDEFQEIRTNLGLAPAPRWKYHLTLGAVDNEDNRERYNQLWEQRNDNHEP